MIQKIHYNFDPLVTAMFNFKNDQSTSTLNKIKVELNRFFKDSKCKEIIFTKNTDKLFFGMCTLPVISGDTAVKIISDDDKIRISEYYIEIDSKLLEIGMTAKELTATLLHEVGHIVNDAGVIDDVRSALHSYLAQTNDHIVITKSVQYRELLAYALRDSVRRLRSMFFFHKEEIIADEFVIACGFGPELESAYRKICKNSLRVNKEVDSKLLVLQWTLRLYKNVRLERIGAIRLLTKGKAMTGSALEKREFDIVTRSLQRIDDESIIEEAADMLVRDVSNTYKKFKYKGMRALEDELYEFSLRAKNVEDQDEALGIIRQINVRLAMIDDYILTEKMTDHERERWFVLMNKYRTVREELSKKTTYNDSYYGLFVKTPVIKSRFDM